MLHMMFCKESIVSYCLLFVDFAVEPERRVVVGSGEKGFGAKSFVVFW